MTVDKPDTRDVLRATDQRKTAEDEQLLDRLASLAQTVGTAQDIHTVFRALNDFVVASTPSNGLFASLYDPETQLRTCVYASSEGEEIDVSVLPPLPMTNSPHSRAVATGQLIVVDDLQAAIQAQPRVDLKFDVNPRLPRSAVAVPMVVMGRVIGAFEIQSPELGAHRHEHITAVRMAANLAAIAVENVRMLERERELRLTAEASEQRFRALIQHASDLILVIGTDGTTQYSSPSVERLLGYHPDQLLKRNVLVYVHPQDMKLAQDCLQAQGASTVSSMPVELRLRHCNGSWRYLEVVTTNLRDDPGVGGVVINAWDITERKRGETHARLLAQASAVLASSLDYEITLGNVSRLAVPDLADWCFVDLVELDGSFRRLAVAHSDATKTQLARDLQRHYLPLPGAPQGVSKVARSGQSEVVREVSELMLIAVAHDATHLRMLRELGMKSYMCVPLHARGSVIGTLSFIATDSERRYHAADLHLAEDLAHRAALAVDNARLFTAERQARADAEAASEMVQRLQVVSDVALAHLALDDLLRELLSRLREILAGDTAALLLLTDDGQQLALHAALGLEEEVVQGMRIPVGQGIAGRIAASREATIVDDLRTVEVASPILRERGVQSLVGAPLLVEGRVLGVVHVGTLHLRQFTVDEARLLQLVADRAALAIDRARLYLVAQEGIRMRDEFLLIAAHELRTPVTAVVASSQLLQRRMAPEKTVTVRDQQALQLIAEQAERLSKLINSLLDLSRIQADQFILERQPVDIHALVRRLVEEVQPTLDRHSLELDTPSEPLIVEGDELRLEQVFQNLLGNAVKYSPHGGLISVRIRHQDGDVTVTITDQGVGIPEGTRSRLFQRFFRAHNIADSNIAGFGIGLYVVNEIVSRHGGTIDVESTEGKGSTFTVRLPSQKTRRASIGGYQHDSSSTYI